MASGDFKDRATTKPGEVTITVPDEPVTDLPPHKFFVAPKGELTEEEAIRMGEELYDSIVSQQAKEARARG